MPLTAGTRLGHYEILAPVGAGGMGEVYRARDPRLNREVAIKISQERFGERFEREARTIAALNHPHICTLFDVGPNYLVMEYVDGQPLRGPLPVQLALQYAAQAADALHAAHVKGVIHRDFKPANVLITKTGVKLLDFGLAKFASQAAGAGDNTATIAEALTKENTILGTLQYMSPEQLEGKPADARSDIFAFGLVLYEAVAGKPAFTAASQASLIAAILKEEPPALSTLEPTAPAALDRVIRKCLAKDPDARWQTAADLRDELQWIAQSSSQPAPPPAAARVRPSLWKWIAAVIMLAIGIAAGIAWQSWRTPKPVSWIATQMNGSPTAHSPTLSPDGQLIAFLTMVDGLTQVAVMKSDGSSWTILTNQKGAGYAADLAWAPDGSKIYFSRYFDQPRGVYSVPALGGEANLLLENALGGLPLPDGSLMVAKLFSNGNKQIQRFFPESGRSESLPAFLPSADDRVPMAVLPGGKEIGFYGTAGTSAEHSGSLGLYVLDLASHATRRVGASLPLWNSSYVRPVAAMPDGKSLLTIVRAEDVMQVVEVPIDGSVGATALFSLPGDETIYHLDAARDGSIYLDTWHRDPLLLHFGEAGGDPQQTRGPYLSAMGVLPGGRIIFPGLIAGKNRLLATTAAGDWRPFVQTAEEALGPMAVSSGGSVAFLIGTPPKNQIAIASARDGRLLQRIAIDATNISSMALSPDGRKLYYAVEGVVWSVPVNGPLQPARLVEGNQVAIDPAGQYLYVEQLGRDPSMLVRVALADGRAEPIPIPQGFRLTVDTVSPNAVDARGRFLFEVASADSFFFSAAMFDPARNSVTRIPVHFEGDVWSPTWSADDRIVAIGAPFSSSIWRFHTVKN